MPLVLTIFVAVAFAVLVLAVLSYITKVAMGCAAVIADKTFSSKLGGEMAAIFFCILFIVLYFLP